MAGVKVTIDIKRLEGLVADLSPRRGFPAGLSRPIAAMYSSWIRRRFLRYARGAGTWPPLSPRRLRERQGKSRAGASKRKRGKISVRGVEILRDTGRLYNSLSLGQGANTFRKVRGGVQFGIQGPGSYPKSGAKIRDVAQWHQSGAGKLPQRKILVHPDRKTKARMTRRIVNAVKRLTRKAHG